MSSVAQTGPRSNHGAHGAMLAVFLVANRTVGLVSGIAIERYAFVLATRFLEPGQAHSGSRDAFFRAVARIGGARVARGTATEFYFVRGHLGTLCQTTGCKSEA